MPEFDKFLKEFKEEEMSSDGAIMWIQALPSSAFTKHGVRRERLQLQAAAPLISRPPISSLTDLQAHPAPLRVQIGELHRGAVQVAHDQGDGV